MLPVKIVAKNKETAIILNKKCCSLTEFINVANLEQWNNIRNINGTLLDLVFSNMKCIVNQTDYELVNRDKLHPVSETEFKLCLVVVQIFLNKIPLIKSLILEKLIFPCCMIHCLLQIGLAYTQ